MLFSQIVIAGLTGTVLGHGYLMSLANRQGGLAYASVCGATIAAKDKTDYTQEVQTLGTPPAACDLFLCKGYQFGDVLPGNVQNYTAGQNVTFHYDLTIPHPGNDPTNITIIDTQSRRVISADLFAVGSLGAIKGKLDISFNMPRNMSAASCKQPGDCVLAFNWDAKSISQTFQSCVDFVMS